MMNTHPLSLMKKGPSLPDERETRAAVADRGLDADVHEHGRRSVCRAGIQAAHAGVSRC